MAFALPRWAYVPGEGGGADEEPLAAAKATVPVRFAGALPPDHPALRYGLALDQAGFFWEAHEVLEAVWMACAPNGRDRHAVRAAIQLANAALKLRMGRPKATLRLLREVLTLLQDLGPYPSGQGFADALDVRALAAAVAARADSLDARAEVTPVTASPSSLSFIRGFA